MPELMTGEWTEQVLQEHRELKEMLARLKVFLDQPRPETGEVGSHTWAAELCRHLVKLHDELYRHFRFEEQGGMVEEISTRHPRAVGQLEEIVDDHPKLLARVRRIMDDTLDYSEGKAITKPQLRRRLTELMEHLDRHERLETDLIQRLEYRDLGAQD